MSGLVILAAVVALWTMPRARTFSRRVGTSATTMTLDQPTRLAFIAWAVVCVAMVAGLVTWAVMR